MRPTLLLAALCAPFTTLALPTSDSSSLSIRIRHPEPVSEPNTYFSRSSLEKRKGGGGGHGGGSDGSSGGKGGSSSSGSGTGAGSNTGGRSSSGSGTSPAYSGGRYAGGATVPFSAGALSPTRSIAPYVLAAGAFAFFPSIWLYSGLYAYPYGYPYYHNENGRNVTANVTCLCQQYSVCGCDPDGDQTFLQDMINNGTDQPVNSSNVVYLTYPNGTEEAFVNGTLDNGTTAAGGTDSSSAAIRTVVQYSGYWGMVAVVAATVLLV